MSTPGLLLRCQECRGSFTEGEPFGWPIWCSDCETRILAAISMTRVNPSKQTLEATPCGVRLGLRYDGATVGVMTPIDNPGRLRSATGVHAVLWQVSMGGGHVAVVETIHSAMNYAAALHIWRSENADPAVGVRPDDAGLSS